MVDRLWSGIAQQLGINVVQVTYKANGNGIPRLLCKLGFHRETTFERDDYEIYTNLKLCSKCGKVLFELTMPSCSEDEIND